MLFSLSVSAILTLNIQAAAQSGCVTFESPLSGMVFSTPSCTVSLRVNCANVVKVELQARYFQEDNEEPVIVSLGTITRPPYKLIWNTRNLPNQLFTGIGILAEATLSNKEIQIARQEGIFFTHNPINRKVIPTRYSISAPDINKTEVKGQKFGIYDSQKSGRANFAWNEKEFIVRVSIKDPSFYSSQPGRRIADAGLEIMIDPARRKGAHPADSTLFFIVPLSGSPYKINYGAEVSGGTFKLLPTSSKINFNHSVELREFKGYDLQLSIPREVFGKSLPDTIGCNLILRLLDEEGQVQKVSLVGGSAYEMYSPIFWADCVRLPKPLLMNGALQWLLFFFVGLALSLAAYMFISKMRKPQHLSNFERSEEERKLFERIKNIIDQDIIKKDLDINYMAQRSGLPVTKLNNLIKRCTGLTFSNYLLFCRAELAKERLRSSRSSEKSIADLCGFSSAVEMEKCFVKFYRTTPYKFRMDQQVA
jgi:AraC-like DNA-binding protein